MLMLLCNIILHNNILSPPSRTSTAPVSPAKPSTLQVIPPTRHTASSVCYHQGGDCGVSRPGPTDWRTASSTRLSGSWTPSRPCPPSPLLHHAPLNSDTPPPPPPPAHHTHHTHTHTHTHCDKHQSLCTALDWPHSTTSSDSLNKDCSLFVTLNRIDLISSLHYTIHILHCLCISLFCTIYHVPYATLSIFYYYYYFYFFLHVLICIFVRSTVSV